MKLGEILVQNKLITAEQLQQALEIQKNQPDVKLGQILLNMGVISADALQNALDSQ